MAHGLWRVATAPARCPTRPRVSGRPARRVRLPADCFCFHGNRPMTWFSWAAPKAADPKWGGRTGGGVRGEATPAREGGGAGRTKSTREGEQPGERGRREAAGVRSRRRAPGEGRPTRERPRVEPGPNWSEELQRELWGQPRRSDSAATTRFVNKRVETVPNPSSQKPGERAYGSEEYGRNQRPPIPGRGVNLQPIRVEGPNQESCCWRG